jgi:hypothetical protein
LLTFNAALSPIELGVFALALVALAASKQALDRWIALLVVSIALMLPVFLSATYGYYAVLIPFVVYGIARACRRELVIAVLAFALLPGMASLMIKDMSVELVANDNAQYAAELDLLTWRVPQGSTIVAEADFWLTLGENRQFYSWNGFLYNRNSMRVSDAEAHLLLGIDYLLCADVPRLRERCMRGYPGEFGDPIEFHITDKTFLLVERIQR